jgi:hypothetical protein
MPAHARAHLRTARSLILVARTTCVMVGIEQCRGFIVGRSLRAAFEREYAGRILMVTAVAQALPGISYVAYKRASGPFSSFKFKWVK